MPFIYLLFSAMIGMSIMLLDKDMMALEYTLCLLNTAIYVIIIGYAGFKDGQGELKIRMENDMYRRRIIETGEDYPIRALEEYKPFKKSLFSKSKTDEYKDYHVYYSKENELEAIEIFGEMAKKGYIYKGLKPIYWCPDCETALAEAEIEYAEDKTNSIFVKFRVGKVDSHYTSTLAVFTLEVK